MITFLDNTGVHGSLSLTETTVRKQLGWLRDETGIDFVAKRFRKDFSCRMEEAGASPELINLHQGREQTGVLFESYITDANRAVRLCRVYIDRMFSEQTEMRRVK